MAVVTPVAGVVHVLDGVLIGAGDGRYLAFAGMLSLATLTLRVRTEASIRVGVAAR